MNNEILKNNLISDLESLIKQYDGKDELDFKLKVNSLINIFTKIIKEDMEEDLEISKIKNV